MTTLPPATKTLKSRPSIKNTSNFPRSRLHIYTAAEFDIWRLIKRRETEGTYNLTLRYRSYKGQPRRPKTTTGVVSRRRRRESLTANSDSDGRESVQTNVTDPFDNEHYFKDDFDFDAEPEPEPVLYPHLVHKPGTYAQELYRRACDELGVTKSTHFYKSLTGDTIIMRRQRLGPMGVKACAIALVETLTVHTLDFTDNNIGPKGAEYLSELLRENNFITHLNLSDNALGGDGVRNLVNVITKLDTLTSLNLSGNGLRDVDAEAVRPIIEDTHHLVNLNLSHNLFREAGGKIIGDALLWNDTIQTLDLSWNHLRRKGAIKIAEAIGKSLGLLTVNLSWNGLYLPGCRALGKALEKNSTLTTLDVSSNRVDRECLNILLKSLRKNTTLETLRVGENPLKPDDATAILSFLQQYPTSALCKLDLKNQLVDESFLTIIQEIQDGGRQLDVVNFRPPGAAMNINDEDERMILEEDPLSILVEFGNMIGVRIGDIFGALDRDGNRSLDHAELVTGLKVLNVPFSEKCVDILIKRLDKDRDGEIDFAELVAAQRAYKDSIRVDNSADDVNQASMLRVRQKLRAIIARRLAGDSKYRQDMERMRDALILEGGNKFQQKIIEQINAEFMNSRDPEKLETSRVETSRVETSRVETSRT